ncbi:MAG: ATP-binding cassette domain-containing protein [Caldilineaceae bacterium]|nr:ATP-binding cassette domain-containing protein [Caldilineaceae bacterium]
MIEVQSIRKSYGPIVALDDVSFSVADGEIVGLLGPNGAGKTTMIKILTGYLQPDEGSVAIDGIDVLTQTQAAQARIGYLPENAPAYPELSVQAYLKLIADLRQVPANEQRERISAAVYAVDLEDRLTQPIGTLSKGYRQRVGLAQAILHRPRLLILDEPSVGLDPTQIVEIRHLIRRLSEFSTILFSTHILPEVEALCNRVLILMNGQVKADANLAELAGASDAILMLDKAVGSAVDTLKALPGVHHVEPVTGDNGRAGFRISGPPETDLCPAIFQLAARHQWPVRELRSDRQTLERVFSKLAA